MDREYLKDLVERYDSGHVTEDEKALVESWYLKYTHPEAEVPYNELESFQDESLNKLLHQIERRHKTPLWPRLAIAASVLIMLSVGIYFLKRDKLSQAPIEVSKINKPFIAPGSNKATITLADGSTIVLNGGKTGQLAKQGKVIINKTSDGQITYVGSKANAPVQQTTYNVATTPRGGQFQFILSDGTKVWLNAASSIKYPVEFTGSERRIELTGEAYFEVAHNAKKPFRVVSNGQLVEVLGTHFNINAYADENEVKTTLLEGSVKIVTGGANFLLKPGQQSQLKNGELNITTADIEEATAWKDGLFHFNDANIEGVMKQLSRWYDVNIRYEGQLKERKFSGEISRNVNATQILDVLTFKKIHYRIDGKTIVIMP
ncbi:FecR family protein [Mucilaginibacter sp. SP1R1]|uniref:FecR family protein n=1 Tax=Mucilaginibacter sp. SP1R1 TaxID=2723091 RepID=UPI0016120C31|nr:FecR domain-containing protein [Mucilaginibacter sp. SP1R1]MBB6148573.1 ferric-dicitrate binding protein FerR (iron transport regulator) [Mucilaginibacter sp. SP1R1]